MNDTEQLISDALKRQAERAPHPGPTLARLRRPARRRSRSSLFLMVGTAVAAAAVLFTAGVIVGRGPSPDDGAAALLPTTAPAQTHLKYSPGWLPDGFVEVYRSAGPEGIVRAWTSQPSANQPFATGQPMVSLSLDGGSPAGYETWEQVQLPGATGYVQVADGQSGKAATVVWKALDLLTVTVRGFADVKATALQFAGSVKPDEKSAVKSALEYHGMSLPRVWGASPSKWTSEIRVEPFTAQVSTEKPDLTGGRPVEVRGKQGTYVPGRFVAVFDHDVWVVVLGDLDEGQLVKIAGDLKVDAKPDFSWIGR
ncbi:hypothetical protein Lesp02_20890 [Lentzea sp. NBRC 105346]|uniref:hypothetical protein n=1 Tax=Lentzea sp. NBRC 105346 TaxID=3032205 RepID=UPI0024A23DB7|nr:hypothetical protein [Lentzea sp. NBRC 105346]GLZ29899.1 hypothetical protein Lesp02_20890 [Lentzea sp. NBRC 105346]